MQLTYEVDPRRRKLLMINVGKYLSAFPVIWLGGFQAMRHYDGARYVSTLLPPRLLFVYLPHPPPHFSHPHLLS